MLTALTPSPESAALELVTWPVPSIKQHVLDSPMPRAGSGAQQTLPTHRTWARLPSAAKLSIGLGCCEGQDQGHPSVHDPL